MEDTHFHVGILGTGLTESILAAALSKAGYSVVHIDENPYYGTDEASLSLDELAEWIDNHTSDLATSRFRRASRSSVILPSSRQYAICLCPTILPSLGPLILALVHSGVSKYSTFRLLDQVAIYSGSSGAFKGVPGSKEDIFKSKEISLVEKRRLMRFLTFAAGDYEASKELEGKQEMPFAQFLSETFSLKDDIAATIAYSLAYCITPSDPTLAALKRLNIYMRSIGRYGPSPFLVGHYGGVGDIAQGFCRAAAVGGAVYILGRKMLALSQSNEKSNQSASNIDALNQSTPSTRYSIELEDVPDTLTCDLLISSSSYVPSNLVSETSHIPSSPSNASDPSYAMARCILIFDRSFGPVVNNLPTEERLDDSGSPEETKERLGSAVLIFPPNAVPGGSSFHVATAVITGEDTLSTPENKSIVYLSLPVNASESSPQFPEDILAPYIDILCQHPSGVSGETNKPIFEAFYMEYARSNPSPPERGALATPTYLVPKELPLVPLPDVADAAATNAEAVFYRAMDILRGKTSSEDKNEVIQFWPPLPRDEDNEEEEW